MPVELNSPELDFYRDLQEFGNDVLKLAGRKTADRNELIGELQVFVNKMLDAYGDSGRKMIDNEALRLTLTEHYAKLYNGEVESVKSMIPGLDRVIHGFMAPNMYVVAGRPGHGKSALVVTIKKNLMQQSVVPYLASAEMSALDYGKRLVAQHSMISVSRQRPGLGDADYEVLNSWADAVCQSPFYVNDSPGLAVEEIKSDLRRLRDEGKKVDIVFVDYAQKLKVISANPKAPDNEKKAMISIALTDIGKEFKVPVICALQENRQADNRKGSDASFSDLKDSGQFEQDAHFIGQLRNERIEGYSDRVIKMGAHGKPVIWKAKLIVTKNRDGEAGDIDLVYHGPLMQFVDGDVR